MEYVLVAIRGTGDKRAEVRLQSVGVVAIQEVYRHKGWEVCLGVI